MYPKDPPYPVLHYLTFVHYESLEGRNSGPQSSIIKSVRPLIQMFGSIAYRFSASGKTKPKELFSVICRLLEQRYVLLGL